MNLLEGFTRTSLDELSPEHNKIWYLQQSALFATVSSKTVEENHGIFTMQRFERKQRIFDIGSPERTIYVVKTGKIRLTRLSPEGKEITITMLAPGSVFGEEALFAQTRRTTSAIVHEDALLCMSKADDLFALLTSDAELSLNVARVLSQRLTDASDTIEDLAYARLPERVLNVFDRLAREHGVLTELGIEIRIRLTHEEIASLVGSTRESVSAEIATLQRAGRLLLVNRYYTMPLTG